MISATQFSLFLLKSTLIYDHDISILNMTRYVFTIFTKIKSVTFDSSRSNGCNAGIAKVRPLNSAN